MNHSKKISKKKYLFLVIFFVFLLILAGIAASYAFFEVSVTNSYTPTNAIVNLDCIDISYTEENTIDLDYNYPITDEYALKNITPVTIKVTNNCTTNVDLVNYTLALTTLRNDEGSIADNKIRFHVKRQLAGESEEILHNNNYLSYLNFMPKGEILNYLNSDLDERENANSYTKRSSYIVDNAYIADGATNIYNVYLWIDYYEGDSEVYNGEEHDESYNNSTAGLNFAAALSLVVNPTTDNIDVGGTAFAIYSDDDKSLTFYKNYDIVSVGSEYKGKTVTAIYTGFEDSDYETVNERPWEEYSNVIEKVSFVDEIAPLSTAHWFSDFYNVSYIDVTNLNTSKVVSMEEMFAWAADGPNVTGDFTIVGMDNWDTSNVIRMGGMFHCMATGASSINLGDLSNWDTSKVEEMQNMFSELGLDTDTLYLGNISNWDTSNVINMEAMFADFSGYSTISLDLSGWNVKNVVSYTLFNAGVEDKVIAPSKFLTVYAIYSETDKSLTFMSSGTAPVEGNVYKNNTITKVYTGFINRHYSSSANIPWASYATVIESVIVENEISPTSTAHWFHNFLNCSYFELTNLNVSKVASAYGMFWDAGYNVESFQITGMNNWNTSNMSDMYAMFYQTGYSASEFEIGDLSKWDTSKATTMAFMFSKTAYNADVFYLGNLYNWDVSKVIYFNSMFSYAGYSASEFEIGDLSKWNTKNVTNMSYMFSNAGYNATVFNLGDLSNWNTSQITDMKHMFRTSGLKATEWYVGKLSNWDVSNVTDMAYMFADSGYNDDSYELDLSRWNTRNVGNMSYMFYNTGYNASTFSVGNISNWDTRNVTNMLGMFGNAGYNASYALNLSRWNVRKVTSYSSFNGGASSKITPPEFGSTS